MIDTCNLLETIAVTIGHTRDKDNIPVVDKKRALILTLRDVDKECLAKDVCDLSKASALMVGT